MSRQFLARWEIDEWADTPVEAAQMALEAQRRADSWATVFDVRDAETGKVVRVDLLEDAEEHAVHALPDERDVAKMAEALRNEFERYAVTRRGHPPLSTRWAQLPEERREKWYALARRALREAW